MPSNNAWNGKWTGVENLYVRCESFRGKKQEEKAKSIIGRYTYNFGDGWRAAINIEQIDAKEATKLRRKSSGFCGYDWMIESIKDNGKIVA